MPDPTLADVLAQYAAACIGDESTEETERSLSIARSFALQYVLANRTALERLEWEQQAQAHCNAACRTPVIERFGDVAPFLSSHRVEIGGNGLWFTAVFAGRDWKSETGR